MAGVGALGKKVVVMAVELQEDRLRAGLCWYPRP